MSYNSKRTYHNNICEVQSIDPETGALTTRPNSLAYLDTIQGSM